MESKQSYILFIFEGSRTEPHIVKNLEKFFLKDQENVLIKAIYGTTIYSLYKKFLCFDVFDEDLETFTLAQEMNDELATIDNDQVAEIYLFFDYDRHASNASDDNLQDMLSQFNNETEKGKLYISYPMVEAIKHLNINVPFQSTNAECNSNYKQIVSNECSEKFKHFGRYDEKTWSYVIKQHAMKANFLVNNTYQFPSALIGQDTIFDSQLKLYNNNDKKVAVLSAFPMFLMDYYGIAIFNAN